MELILYTTHCPKCSVLEKKLAKKGLNYTEFTSIPVSYIDFSFNFVMCSR